MATSRLAAAAGQARLAAAITRRSPSMSPSRRCSFRGTRSGSPTIAISSFKRASNGIHFKMRSRIAIDRVSGRIQAFAADHVLDGGGLANFSASVAAVAATGALGICEVPRADITTAALHSRGVTFARGDGRVDAGDMGRCRR